MKESIINIYLKSIAVVLKENNYGAGFFICKSSKDIQHIYSAKENGTKISLFVRKNKDDNTSKEFYFLGEIDAVGEPKAIVMKNVDKIYKTLI